jgi:hypothetical protein
MKQQQQERGLISRRLHAEVLVLATALAWLSCLRTALSSAANYADSGYQFQSMWARLAVDVVFYGFLLWVCLFYFRKARGIERIVVTGWAIWLILGSVQHLFSIHAARAVEFVKLGALAVALVAAILILSTYLRNSEKAASDTSS